MTQIILQSLALLYQIQGHDARAEAHYLKMLKVMDTTDSGLLPLSNQILGALADMYREQERNLDLEKILTTILSLKKSSAGEEHIETANIMMELATVQEALGAWRRLEQQLRAAFQILRRDLGPQHERTMSCLRRLAAAQEKIRRQNELSQANVEWQG